MENMTWKEFKDAVDKKLKEDSRDENTEIEYIDISFPGKGDFEKGRFDINVVGKNGISIS
jgi:hypothetical protein